MHPTKSEIMMMDGMDEGKAGERSGALEISTDKARLTGASSTGPATPSLTPVGSISSPPNSPYRSVCRHWKSFGRRTIGRLKGMIGIGEGAAKIAAVSQRHRRHSTSVRTMRRGKTMDKNGEHHSSDRDLKGAASGSVLLSGGRSVKGMNRPDKNNEDEFFQFDDLFNAMCVPSPDGIEKLGAFGVFDGHGGASCSSFVCRHLPVEVARSPEWKRLAPVDIDSCKGEPMSAIINSRSSDELLSDVMRGALLDGFRKTQEKFLEFANARGKDSGSTAVVALVCGREVVIANLGDSEALFCDNCTPEGNSKPIIARTQVSEADSFDWFIFSPNDYTEDYSSNRKSAEVYYTQEAYRQQPPSVDDLIESSCLYRLVGRVDVTGNGSVGCR